MPLKVSRRFFFVSEMAFAVRVTVEDFSAPKSNFEQKAIKSPQPPGFTGQRSFCSRCYNILSGEQHPIEIDGLYRYYEYHKTTWQWRASVSQGCHLCSVIWDRLNASQQQTLMNLNTGLRTMFSVISHKDVTIGLSTVGPGPKLREWAVFFGRTNVDDSMLLSRKLTQFEQS